MQIGLPTGGDMGAGTINLKTGCYINGVPGCGSASAPGFSIVAYGADPTGATDSDTALANAAAAAATAKGCVIVPNGLFKFASQFAYTQASGSFCLLGTGQQLSKMYWPAGSGGLAITLADNYSQSVHIRDLSLLTGTTAGGIAIDIINGGSNPNGALEVSDITNVTAKGYDGGDATDYWTLGLSTTSISYLNAYNLSVVGSSSFQGNCADLAATISVPSFITNFYALNCQLVTTALTLGNWVQGVVIGPGSNIGAGTGISVPGSESGFTQLTITGTQSNTNTFIDTESALPDIILRDNLIITQSGHVAVLLNQAQRGSIVGNHFLVSGSPTASIGVQIGGPGSPTLGGLIDENIFEGYATAINLTSSSVGWQVGPNNRNLGNTVFITNAGANSGLVTETLADATPIAVDAPSLQNSYAVTLNHATGTRQLANPTHLNAGASLIFAISQDGTGGAALTFGSDYNIIGGSTIATGVSAKNILSCWADTAATLNCVLANAGITLVPGGILTSGGAANGLFYDDGSHLQELATALSSVLTTDGSGNLVWATSLNLAYLTIGTAGGEGAGTINLSSQLYDNGTAATGSAGSGYVRAGAPTIISPITTCHIVSALPGGTQGQRDCVTDALTCTFGSTPTGGHSAFCPVIYNGSAWIGG